VLAAEVRALSTCGTFDRLFDRLTQFVSQVMSTVGWLSCCIDLRTRLHAPSAFSPPAAARAYFLARIFSMLTLVASSKGVLYDQLGDIALPGAILEIAIPGNRVGRDIAVDTMDSKPS